MTGGYDLSLISAGLIGFGAFLILEHVLRFRYLEFELMGHETYGVVFLVAGLLVGYVNYLRLG